MSSRKCLSDREQPDSAAACPRPQIEASAIARPSSSQQRHVPFRRGDIKARRPSPQPTRHGVHWPQLSSSKKRIRLSAADVGPVSVLIGARITTAWRADQSSLRSSSLPNSSGRSAFRRRQDAAGRTARQVTLERHDRPPYRRRCSSINSRTVTPASAPVFTPGSADAAGDRVAAHDPCRPLRPCWRRTRTAPFCDDVAASRTKSRHC